MNREVAQFVKKAKDWSEEMEVLRAFALQSGLEENLKWGQPCYSLEGRNVAIIQPFKNFLGLMFFKGSLLKDPKKVLIDNGPNSRAAKRLEFRSIQDVTRLKAVIKSYLKEAIAIEASGKKVDFKKSPQAAPAELKQAFVKNARLKKAFEALTPGRQRAYLLHFSGAKQAATRESRIAKCAPRILQGKGLND